MFYVSDTVLDHARELAAPTIRHLLSRRRNAVAHGKLEILEANTDQLVRAVRSALKLGLTADTILGVFRNNDDRRTLVSVFAHIRGGN